ncbi:hypothetical protein ES815_09400 [Leclercia adecarboxylata]|uniref:Uncharacterized protein n=1 Tax=Leclercia adecarboxylata TaxID=83655 RepID=A0AAP9AIC3_9ENTR|nr:hypothetical protein ES815_09400 [Leclercia adecarboxylata]
MSYSFCVAKVPAGRDVHNLVVPLSFRCIYSFVSPPCYLSGGPLTSRGSLKGGGFTLAAGLSRERSIRSPVNGSRC